MAGSAQGAVVAVPPSAHRRGLDRPLALHLPCRVCREPGSRVTEGEPSSLPTVMGRGFPSPWMAPSLGGLLLLYLPSPWSDDGEFCSGGAGVFLWTVACEHYRVMAPAGQRPLGPSVEGEVVALGGPAPGGTFQQTLVSWQ